MKFYYITEYYNVKSTYNILDSTYNMFKYYNVRINIVYVDSNIIVFCIAVPYLLVAPFDIFFSIYFLFIISF